jgi:hypothetical protein
MSGPDRNLVRDLPGALAGEATPAREKMAVVPTPGFDGSFSGRPKKAAAIKNAN